MSHSISHRGLSVGILFSAIVQVLYPATVQAQSLPTGGTPVAGVSGITTTGNTTTVNVTGSRALVNWDRFNVAEGNTFQANGPGNFLLVNRVTGGVHSVINGLVQSTGNIWILNSAGFIVGSTGRFDVGGLLLSTSSLADFDILDGNRSFDFSAASGNVVLVEPGAQLTANGGSITLMGATVHLNGGAFDAAGDITLLGARGAQVTFDSDLNAVTELTLTSGTNAGLGVYAKGPTSFSGSRTIMATAGMADLQGNIVLDNGDAASALEFVDGDVVLYAGHRSDYGPQQLISGGAVVGGFGSSTLTNAAQVRISGGLSSPGNLWVHGAGGVGHGMTDLDLRAAGTLDINVARGRDIALHSDGAMRVGAAVARDDLVISSNGNIVAGQLFTGAIVDSLAAIDQAGAADAAAGATLAGHDMHVRAGTSSTVELLARPLVSGDYFVSAGDFLAGGALNPDFRPGVSNAFRIDDTAGGFTLGFNIVAPGDFTLNSVGELTILRNITSLGGDVSLYGGSGLTVNGDVTTGTDPGRSITLGTGMHGDILQQIGMLTTNALNANAGGQLGLSQRNEFYTGAFSARDDLFVRGHLADVTITGATSTFGNVNLSAQNGMRLADATVSAGGGSAILNGDVTLTGSNTVSAVNGVVFVGTIDSAGGAATLAVTTPGPARFDGNIGAASALTSLTVNGPSRFRGTTVQTSDGITLNGPASADNSVMLDAGAGFLATGDVIAPNGNIIGRGSSITMGTVTAGGPVGSGALDPPLRTIDLAATDGNLDFAGGSAYQTSLSATGSIDVTGALRTYRLTGNAGGAATFGGENQIWNLGPFVSNGLTLRNDAQSLIVDGVVDAGAGDVRIEVLNENLQVDPTGQIRGRDVALASSSFFNRSGADGVQASGHWAIYQQFVNPGAEYDGLDSGAHAIWGQTIDTLAPSAIDGNRYVFAFRPTLTFTSTSTTKTYGDVLTGTGLYTVTGFQPGVAGAYLGDTADSAFSGSPAVTSAGFAERAPVAGGPYAIDIANGSLASGYQFAFASTGQLTIDPKGITGTATTTPKTYDGTTDGSGTISLTGVVAGDDLDATGTFTFSDRNAGTGKTVTLSGVSLTGADAGNYTLTVPSSLLGDILRKAISGSVAVTGKTYDGTTAGAGTVMLHDVVAGDDVSGSATFTFADRNAGTGKAVAVSGATLSGADAGNYTLTLPASALGDILRKAITGTPTVTAKTYDGTTDANGAIMLTGVVAGDDLDASGTFTFADRNAGAGKTVTVSGVALTGADAGNYTLTVPASVLGDILQKVIDGMVAVDTRTYDGTTGATGSIALAGVVAGDDVGATGTFTFADRNAGAGKQVIVSGVTLNGADAGNYSIRVSASALGEILRKSITGLATVVDKTYDGTRTGTGSIALAGVVAGDDVGATGTYAFSDANAGTGKTVAVEGAGLTGSDAGNYTLVVTGTTVADILRRAITVTADPASKPLGSADPELTYAITEGSLVAGESLSGALARAAGESPGTYAIGQGTLDATANYQLTFVGSTLTITPVENDPTDGLARNDDFSGVARYIEDDSRGALAAAEPLRIVDERARCAGTEPRDDVACDAGRPD